LDRGGHERGGGDGQRSGTLRNKLRIDNFIGKAPGFRAPLLCSWIATAIGCSHEAGISGISGTGRAGMSDAGRFGFEDVPESIFSALRRFSSSAFGSSACSFVVTNRTFFLRTTFDSPSRQTSSPPSQWNIYERAKCSFNSFSACVEKTIVDRIWRRDR
jgi:hypothetical protein